MNKVTLYLYKMCEFSLTGLTTGIIPDAATIFAMKKQRERARQLGTGADFVPLKATTKKFKDRTTGSISRLVREEDEDSEEERIEFKGTHKKSFPALERRKEVRQILVFESAYNFKERCNCCNNVLYCENADSNASFDSANDDDHENKSGLRGQDIFISILLQI